MKIWLQQVSIKSCRDIGYRYNLPESVRLSGLQLLCQVKQRCDPLGARKIRDTGKVLKDRRIYDWVCVLVVVREEATLPWYASCCHYECSLRVDSCIRVEPVICIVNGFIDGKRIDSGSAPQFALLESIQVELRDDAEVVAAASKSEEQVWILIRISIDDATIGYDNLFKRVRYLASYCL